MTSLSVFLRARGVLIEGQQADPGTLNFWLRNNGGYVCADGDCDNLNLPSVEALDSRLKLVNYETSFALADIIQWVKSGWAVRFSFPLRC